MNRNVGQPKPFYRRRWFIVLAVIVGILVIGGLLAEDELEVDYEVAGDIVTPGPAPETEVGSGSYEADPEPFMGVNFEVPEVFIVEGIFELTQYHLTEEQRESPDTIYMIEYHMGDPVLFIPGTVLNEHMPPGAMIRNRTPTGRLSIFEADTLNGREIIQGFVFTAGHEDAIINGYFAFLWDGYGEYRTEVLTVGNDMIAEFVFVVSSDNAFPAD